VIALANYWYWSKRRKPEVVESEKQLPEGVWVKVPEAAKITRYSRQTIYMRFYTGQCDGYKISEGPLLVNLNQIK